MPDDQLSGRLELTWTNKSRALLRHIDGTYEWVPPSDYRVAEVRLLHDAGTTGETHLDRQRARDNLLIRGDSLNALASLARLPEFKKELLGKVKLIYIDPPFNTGEAFEQYDDNLEHSTWLTMMRDRLRQAEPFLHPDGSIWLHLNDDEGAYGRVLMDEVFGRRNFVTTVVWQKRTSRENRAAFGQAHDFIHVYSPAGPTRWRDVRNRLSREGSAAPTNPDKDPRGPWISVPFSAQGFRKNQMYDITTPTGVVHQPPKGRCWAATEPEYRKLLKEKLIYFPRGGSGRPRVKQFEQKPLVPMSLWLASEVGTTEEAKKEILALFPEVEPFDTPKPERLMERIIHISTKPGDLVLDFFAGSGTTVAVAHKMGRRWVAAEWERETLETFIGPRLTQVVAGEDLGGATEQVGWEGGGGFRVLDIAPSMLEADEGFVYLADWAVGGALAEVTAAQLGFEFEPDARPFCGRKGRLRLAVIDGLASPEVAELLVQALADDERLVLCAEAVDPDTAQSLRELRPGSRVRKIPASILAEYRQQRLWWPRESRASQPSRPDDADVPSRAGAGLPTSEAVSA